MAPIIAKSFDVASIFKKNFTPILQKQIWMLAKGHVYLIRNAIRTRFFLKKKQLHDGCMSTLVFNNPVHAPENSSRSQQITLTGAPAVP